MASQIQQALQVWSETQGVPDVGYPLDDPRSVPPYTPGANTLQVAFVSAFQTTGTGSEPSGELTFSGGLTWTKRVNGGSATPFGIGSAVWTAPVGGSPSEISPTIHTEEVEEAHRVMAQYMVYVAEITGHNVADPVGVSGQFSTSSTGVMTVTLSGAPAADSLLLGLVAISNGGGTALTPMGGYSEIFEITDPYAPTRWQLQSRTGSASTSFQWTMPGTPEMAHGIVIEIKNASGGGAAELDAEQGSVAVVGQAAALLRGRRLQADQGATAVSGQAQNLLFNRSLPAAVGAFGVSGSPALGDYAVSAAGGSVSAAGQVAGLACARRMVADQGACAVSGQVANLIAPRQLVANQGALAVVGQAAGLTVARRLVVEVGALGVVGQDATLDFDPIVPPGQFALAAEQGTVSIAGLAAVPRVSRVLGAAGAMFNVSGQAIKVPNPVLAAGQSEFVMSGQEAELTHVRVYSRGRSGGGYLPSKRPVQRRPAR